MIRLITQVFLIITITSLVDSEGDNESKLSSILLPSSDKSSRITRSYYERYGYGRPYDRLDDRRCGRCDDDDRDDDRDDRDDRHSSRPTYGSRRDRNRDDDDNDDKPYNTDRKSSKNETDDQSDKDRDDKDRHRDRPRNKHRNRYDDRDRYGLDYYDRFFRDRNRDRYDEPYPRRPLYDRNAYPYDSYDRYDGYRRPSYYDDRYNDGYGGYGPGVGTGPHDSFRPWDETYRGQSGWDAGGRGYYFASGRPDYSAWSQREYARPQPSSSWQNAYQNPSYSNDYAAGFSSRDPYRGTNAASYGSGFGGYQDAGYSQSSGWRNVGETRRPYRDESNLGFGYRNPVYDSYQGSHNAFNPGDRQYGSSGVQYVYGQTGVERRPYRDESGVTKLDSQYNQSDNRYGRPSQPSSYLSNSQSTTETSYLLGRDDQLVQVEDSTQKDAQ